MNILSRYSYIRYYDYKSESIDVKDSQMVQQLDILFQYFYFYCFFSIFFFMNTYITVCQIFMKFNAESVV